MGLDAGDLKTIERLRAAGVPVIVVLVSGRPLDVAAELPGWDALLAAWLPGTEGAGVADVLFGDVEPTGRLPVTWMRAPTSSPSTGATARRLSSRSATASATIDTGRPGWRRAAC